MKTRNEIIDYAVMIEQKRFITDQSQKTGQFLRDIAEQLAFYEDALSRIRDLSNIAAPKKYGKHLFTGTVKAGTMPEKEIEMDWKLIAAAIWTGIGFYLIVGTFAFDVMHWWGVAIHLLAALAYIGTAENVTRKLFT